MEFFAKQFSESTWNDFVRLFESHPAPGAFPCWCMYNHRPGPPAHTRENTRLASIERNRRDKKALAMEGRSRGILVYAEGEPVGWCQFGRREELPRIDKNPIYVKLATRLAPADWRITCFVVVRRYRRRGVARAALKAALTAIETEGGGLVEAYPIKRWGAYQQYRGLANMFKDEGFKIVAALGRSNVLMRRLV